MKIKTTGLYLIPVSMLEVSYLNLWLFNSRLEVSYLNHTIKGIKELEVSFLVHTYIYHGVQDMNDTVYQIKSNPKDEGRIYIIQAVENSLYKIVFIQGSWTYNQVN